MGNFTKRKILTQIKKIYDDDPIIVPLADTVRLMNELGRKENELYILGSMGMPVSIATGIAKGLQDNGIKRKCVCIEGDGGLLLNYNSILTAQFLELKNLIIIVLDNEQYGATGQQPTYTTKLKLENVAKELGYKTFCITSDSSEADIINYFEEAKSNFESSYYINIKIDKGHETAPVFYDNPAVLMNNFQNFMNKIIKT